MYLADRKSILETDYPITGDSLFALEHGPIISNVMDYIRGIEDNVKWNKHFKTRGYKLVLKLDPGNDELSAQDEIIAQELYETHKNKDWGQMEKFVHDLYEWKKNDPGKSRKAIDVRDIFEAENIPEHETALAYKAIQETTEMFDAY